MTKFWLNTCSSCLYLYLSLRSVLHDEHTRDSSARRTTYHSSPHSSMYHVSICHMGALKIAAFLLFVYITDFVAKALKINTITRLNLNIYFKKNGSNTNHRCFRIVTDDLLLSLAQTLLQYYYPFIFLLTLLLVDFFCFWILSLLPGFDTHFHGSVSLRKRCLIPPACELNRVWCSTLHLNVYWMDIKHTPKL